MGKLKAYQIDLKSLSPTGAYEFNYVLDDAFFEQVDGPEVRQGKVTVSLSVVRALSAFELDFHLKGKVTVTCDRCLEDMEVPVETINRLIVTLGNMYAETTDEQVVISEEEGFINVAWYMYEFIALAIPMKHVHNPGECNEEMASKLKELCVDDLNENEDDEVSDTEESNQAVDPRWDALRHLIGDN